MPSIARYPATHHGMAHSMLLRYALRAGRARQIPFDHLELEPLIVLRHEKHPKGWMGIQLLGCSSRCGRCQSSISNKVADRISLHSPDFRRAVGAGNNLRLLLPLLFPQSANHMIPIAHCLEVLLPRKPNLIPRISWITANNSRRYLEQFHAEGMRPILRTACIVRRHDYFASLIRRSVKLLATLRT